MRAVQAESILDVGCGDANWLRLFSGWQKRRYVGIDHEPEHIALARERIPEGEFIEADLLEGIERAEGKFDLALSRHVMQHLETGYNLQLLDAIAKKTRYYLFTNYSVPRNVDLPPSKFRPVNLRLAPYFLTPTQWYTDGDLDLIFGEW